MNFRTESEKIINGLLNRGFEHKGQNRYLYVDGKSALLAIITSTSKHNELKLAFLYNDKYVEGLKGVDVVFDDFENMVDRIQEKNGIKYNEHA